MSNERSSLTTAEALSAYEKGLQAAGFNQPVIDQLIIHASQHFVLGHGRRGEDGSSQGVLTVLVDGKELSSNA
ncbi:D-alanine-D-alanine ligase-like ATP-grasp enzyme [Rhodococcus sp. 27YEA15]|uniref:hypothetical protein n=1 Tax=Rhodococcus sp. 27YEA15 TaxID=3156259 RepID=UPI003C7D7587